MIEINNIVLLCESPRLYGARIKVVGTSFRDHKFLATGQSILKEFFKTMFYDSVGMNEIRELFDDAVFLRTGSIIKEIEKFQKDISEFVKIEREPNNPYDPNAIIVYVNYDSRFMKVGYFPKDLAEIAVKNKYKNYLVGYEKDGRGMILSMIFKSPEIQVVESITSPVYDENKNLGFMSLNKMRKRLCK